MAPVRLPRNWSGTAMALRMFSRRASSAVPGAAKAARASGVTTGMTSDCDSRSTREIRCRLSMLGGYRRCQSARRCSPSAVTCAAERYRIAPPSYADQGRHLAQDGQRAAHGDLGDLLDDDRRRQRGRHLREEGRPPLRLFRLVAGVRFEPGDDGLADGERELLIRRCSRRGSRRRARGRGSPPVGSVRRRARRGGRRRSSTRGTARGRGCAGRRARRPRR